MAEYFRSSFPPKATLTEKNLKDQAGKVFIVTGSTAGIGEKLAAILYQHNAKVYVAARSQEKATKTIKEIKDLYPSSTGDIDFLHLDLSDLTTIKKSTEEFLSKENRLDVLWNNAGVMIPPQGSKTVQGYELQLGTNNLGHFLFTKLLRPILAKTASTAAPNSVRVVWVASMAAQLAPKPAIDFENMEYKKDESAWIKYSRSKAGNVLHAAEFARITKAEGIVSMSLNPGNLKTSLQRHTPAYQMLLINPLLYTPIHGAYTELYTGLSPDITLANSGTFVAPWGRLIAMREDLLQPELGAKYWKWTEEQVTKYE